MNIMYFQPEKPNQSIKKEDKGLLSPEQLRENAHKKAQKIEQSKVGGGLLQRNEGKLLTDDGRQIFNENK